MGCSGSKEAGPPHEGVAHDRYTESSKEEEYNPLTQEEVNARIQCSTKSETYTLGNGVKLRYAYLSQRGYYPEDLHKNNQDAFKIVPTFGGDQKCIFMGVFDGHGQDGDHCAYFVRDNIEKHLLATTKQYPQDFELAYKQAFVNCNDEMHLQDFDDSMSGTTAITAFFKDGEVFVANIGDSRAIVGEKKGKRVVAYSLSLDQTPYRQDERERVKAAGGVIMSCDQLEGIVPFHENWGVNLGDEIDSGGDPPRVWAPNKSFPGCAFTRSLGDHVAHDLGVFAEPELSCKELTPDDKFIVLASDGVWEFLTNQSVTDMIMKFQEPLDACRAVVAESYRLWLQYEVRTDDITMILAFLEDSVAATDESRRTARRSSHHRENRRGSASGLSVGLSVVGRAGGENRPVRRGLSKEKRQQMMVVDNEEEEEDASEFTPVLVPKSEREMASIMQAIKTNFLFQHLNESQSKLVYDIMKRVNVKKGDKIIKQGDPGDLFYIVETGEYAVTVRAGDDQIEVLRYSTAGGNNPCFGELALMYSKPRAATVTAMTDGQLWSMDRRSFRKIVMRSSATSLMTTLRSVDVLKTLSVGQLQRLQDILSEVVHKDGETVIRQGDIGDTFYIVMEGKAVVTRRAASAHPDTSEETLMELSVGQYFGEKALLDQAPRAANVIAKGKLKCLHISKDAFEEVLGPLQAIIDEDSKWREKVAHTKKLRMEAEGFATVSRHDFKPICSGGELDLGELVVASHKRSEYTLRAVSKAKTVELGQQHRLMSERAILGSLMTHNSFVPLALAHFHDEAYLYTVFKLRTVSDLGTLLDRITVNEESASFYLASAMAAIEFLHSEGIVYRNLSPDSLCIDSNGYLQLMDMRYAVKPAGENLTDYYGCATYLSPEQITGQGHGMPSDFWGMGILLYEMLTGSAPWQTGTEGGDSEVDIYARISAHQSGQLELPQDLEASDNLVALVNELLDPEPLKRIGARGAGMEELRAHPWFIGLRLDFQALHRNALPAPSLVLEAVQTIADQTAQQGAGACLKKSRYEGDTKWFESFSSDKV